MIGNHFWKSWIARTIQFLPTSCKFLRGNVAIPYPCIRLLKGPQSNPNSTILPSPSGIPRSAANTPKHCHYLVLWQPSKCYSSLKVRPLPVERCCCNTIWCFTRVIDKVLRVFSLVVPMSRTLIYK